MNLFAPTPDNIARLRERYPRELKPHAWRRFKAALIVAGVIGLFAFGLYDFDFSPWRIASGLAALGRFVALMVPPSPEGHAAQFLKALGETVAIALLGTLTAAVLAFPFSLLAAKNVVKNPIVHFLARRVLDVVRSIDTLVLALIWIAVVGLGPFAGVLAIATSDFGALGKLFSETLEAAETNALEGVRAAGGRRADEIRFGVVPQALPVIVGQVLYFFESNTRSATIIGIVGAGGIGLELYEAIRTLEWRQVSFIVILILVAVAAIDFVSGKLRAAMG